MSDLEKFREHSITLNTIGWKMAVALGDVEPTADLSGSIQADPEELLDRLLDQIIELKGLA